MELPASALRIANDYIALLISVTLNMAKKYLLKSLAQSECEVQTMILQEGRLFERVVDHSSFVRLEDLPSTAAEQHIPLEKPVLQAPRPTPPLID